MSAAAQVVRAGRDDRVRGRVPRRLPDARPVPRGADRRRLARGAARGDRRAQRTVADQWQIQIQAGIQARSRVIVHTSYLSDAELGEAHLEQTADVESTVRRLLEDAGRDAASASCPTGR